MTGGGGGPVLAVDTATTRAVIALGDPAGGVVEIRDWVAGYRHGEELLARLDALLRDRGVAPPDLAGLIVGTGPGAFTGLRVGLSTVKGLAYALGLPVVGVATSDALLSAAGAVGARDAAGPEAHDRLALLLPAGPADRTLCRPGEAARILPGGMDPDRRPGERLVAVDLQERAPAAALRLGEAARAGLGAALLALGAPRLAAGDADDLARLSPVYVSLPRGVRAAVPDTAVAITGGGRDR